MIRFHSCEPFYVSAVGLLLGALCAPAANANFKPDLVLATRSPDIGVYCKGNGSGGFICNQLAGEVADSFGVAAGDVDGDHHLDLAFANVAAENGICYGSSTPDAYECNNVTFAESTTVSVALGHIDSDPFVDIVYANGASDRDRVCRWVGMGLFDCTDISTDQLSSFDVALGDVNGDGKLDALFAVATANTQSRVCLGDGLGGFVCGDISGSFRASFGIAVADFNADGTLDVVLANDRQANQVCSGNGDGTFACSDLDAVDRQSFDVAIGDFNADGDPDLVFANQNLDTTADNAGPNRVCYGKSGMDFACEDLSADAADASGVAVADWNRDGADDIALANNGSPSRICLGNNDSTFTCSNISEDSYDARGIAAIVPPPIYPVENDFRIETEASPSFKVTPAVSSAANRGSVITWRSRELLENELFARVYDTDGQSISDVFPVESFTDGGQDSPDVAMAPDGSFVIVWSFDGLIPPLQSPRASVAGRRFDATGMPIGPEFLLPNLFPGQAEEGAAVAIAPDGSFLAVWHSFGVPGNPFELSILGRRYNAAGDPQGDEFLIDQQAPESHYDPRVAALSDGSFVVAWESEDQDGFGAGVFARVVYADGSMPDDEFQVNVHTLGDQENPGVAAGDGRFVITWESPQDLDDSVGIRARIFDGDGSPATGEIPVNEPSSDAQLEPRAAFGAGGRFVIAWQNFLGRLGRGVGILVQEFEPSGKKVDAQFSANRSSDEIGDIGRPDVTGARDGRVVFVWPEELRTQTTRGQVYRRRFENSNVTATGGTTTTTLEVTTTTLVATTSTTTTSTTTSTTVSTTTTSSTTTTLPSHVCGDPIGDTPLAGFDHRSDQGTAATVTASDALYILNVAVGAASCEPCICDVDNSGAVTAVDALATLQSAIGLDVELVCPACVGT
jgi:hypothetical protein